MNEQVKSKPRKTTGEQIGKLSNVRGEESHMVLSVSAFREWSQFRYPHFLIYKKLLNIFFLRKELI